MSTQHERLKHLESKNQTTILTIPQNFIQFNDMIGLPRHPSTLEPTPLMEYQNQFFNDIDHTDCHKFHVNKSRQIGFTELILRILAFRCFNKYAAGNIIIIAGTREQTAKAIMQRFKNLFYNISHEIVNQSDISLELKNGTIIKAYPSNSDSIRGLTKISAIFLDEAAHFNLIDDSKVMDAIQPIVDTNQSDLFMISTPNGPRGFFYDINTSENDFLKFTYNIYEAVGTIYTKEQAENMLADTVHDTDQEFLNKFTTGRDSIWGEVTPEHRTDEEEMILDADDLNEIQDVTIEEEIEPDIPAYAYSTGKSVIYPT